MAESVVIVDKHPGPTSFDMVRLAQRLFPNEKIGHGGSLDPFASGVLVLLFGKATKLSQGLLNADKVYEGKLKLGERTDSLDITGTLVETKPVPEISEADVLKVFSSFIGTWNQVPPAFSAKKVKGVRLYELARENIHLKLEPRPVQIYRLELKAFESPFISFTLACSKGTYVRSLALEIGERLGTVAHLVELRRTQCGHFTLNDAVTAPALEANPSEALGKGFPHYQKLQKNFRVTVQTHLPTPSDGVMSMKQFESNVHMRDLH